MRGEALHVGALFVMWNFRTCSDGSLLALSHSIEQPGSKPEHTRASHSHLERRASHTRDCLLEFEKASCPRQWRSAMPRSLATEPRPTLASRWPAPSSAQNADKSLTPRRRSSFTGSSSMTRTGIRRTESRGLWAAPTVPLKLSKLGLPVSFLKMFYSHMRLRYGSGLLKQDVMDHPFMFGHLRCRPRC